ncbi:MAG: hypothetical protein PHU62_09905 [Bacteroidales bacterium]|jgi:hypothetical protein|nr:hypothetical protein [Bacteroidales bacterium]MDD2205587.1 hypothetical protein [Bacteroidales bacterium]MDD3152455.1 hypothetical protein [Bacteroidales bacterium]MDD3915030.1 hypothetical protein [Bacteroidales bacterium]MDD4634863.1 hypothetical protein [Bacteroidales bacterium]
MSSSRNRKEDLLIALFNSSRRVFTMADLALLSDETNYQSLSNRIHKIVKTGKLQSPRKGIYTKTDYQPEELACRLYTPSYISLEYVLQRAGVVFQYDTTITAVSYVSRNLTIDNYNISYRKIKNEWLATLDGIIITDDGLSIATPERAFLDLLYLNGDTYFDNLNKLDKTLISNLLTAFRSKKLTERATKILNHNEY